MSTRTIDRRQLLACLIAPFLTLFGAGVAAGEGHDHGDGAPAPSANGPQRLPDGNLFMPKPAQRQIGLRTQVVELGDLPRTVDLNGKVIMDPNAGGRVQAAVAGRIESGPAGLPGPGQRVSKGQILAWVIPTTSAIERSNQAAQIAEMREAKSLADRRVARLRGLADTVPRKEIDAAVSDAASLAQRIAAVAAGLDARDVLTAPVSGVIAAAHVVAGQIVDAREIAFEIVDPMRFRIEAFAFDTGIASDIASASLASGRDVIPLRFIGAARVLKEQSLPLYFDAQGAALSALALGQPVQLQLQTRSTVRGAPIPAASLMRDPSNRTIVWVKVAPERFEPRAIQTESLDGVRIAVTSGLQSGDRIATQGAALLNQVR